MQKESQILVNLSFMYFIIIFISRIYNFNGYNKKANQHQELIIGDIGVSRPLMQMKQPGAYSGG
jgi:hypothetical protein